MVWYGLVFRVFWELFYRVCGWRFCLKHRSWVFLKFWMFSNFNILCWIKYFGHNISLYYFFKFTFWSALSIYSASCFEVPVNFGSCYYGQVGYLIIKKYIFSFLFILWFAVYLHCFLTFMDLKLCFSIYDLRMILEIFGYLICSIFLILGYLKFVYNIYNILKVLQVN